MPISPAMCVPSLPPPNRLARLMPATPRRCGPSSPKTCCLATSMPISEPRGYRPRTSRRSQRSCSVSIRRRFPSRICEGCGVEHRAQLCHQGIGRRHVRVRHAACQRHMASGTGAEHENADHLRHDRPRRPRGARHQPGSDAGRTREAEAHQGEASAPGYSPIPTAPSA